MVGTVNIVELAKAIGKTENEFRNMLPALVDLGFPEPTELPDEYEIGAVLDWVGQQQTLNLSIVTMVTEKLLRH